MRLIWLSADDHTFVDVFYDETYIINHVNRLRNCYAKKLLPCIVDEIQEDRLMMNKTPKINEIIINKNITSHEIFISFKFKNILYHRQKICNIFSVVHLNMHKLVFSNKYNSQCIVQDFASVNCSYG
jgi:hypothetical protein